MVSFILIDIYLELDELLFSCTPFDLFFNGLNGF